MSILRFAKRSSAAMIAALAVGVPVCSGAAVESNAAVSNADRVVEYAKSKTYITSRPNEVTNFYGLVCDWCSMFVYYCAYQNGVGSSVPNKTFCDSQHGYKGGVEVFKDWGRWQYSAAKGGTYVPVRGDVIYFDWDLDGWSDHVGYVDYVKNGYVHTVEGNAGTYGDCVKMNCFPLNYENILGYGTPDYGDAEAAPLGTAKKAADITVAVPMVNVKDDNTQKTQETRSLPAKFRVSSPIGAWLRAENSSTGRKIGILSTDQIVEADKICGNWVHIAATTVEDSDQVFSGWTAVTNLSEDVPEETATTAAPAEIAETTTTPAPAPKAAEAEEPAPQVQGTDYTAYRVSSEIGAWFRSSAKFSESNKTALLDTDDIVYVYDITDGWAYAMVSENGGNSYKFGYIHTSVIAPVQESAGTQITESNATYMVTSSIGCRLRSEPKFEDGNTVMILDTYDTFEALSSDGEWVYAKINAGGYVIYGYVHTSTITRI